MKYFITTLLIILSSNVSAEDLLKGYDSTKPSHGMQCWTGQTGMKKYEIIGKQIVIDNVVKFDFQQNEGNIYAGKTSTMFGDLTLILDYDQKKVTQKSSFGQEVFDCN